MNDKITNFSIYILTYNDEKMISRLLTDLEIVEKVIVVDSFSSDATAEIVQEYGRTFVQNKFYNQATQSNWVVENYFNEEEWVLRLDSDERVTEELLRELEKLVEKNDDCVGYIRREMYWMGKKLKFSSIRNHYIGRFYKPQNARYEEVTEEHLLHQCDRTMLRTCFYEDNIKNDISFFIDKHLQTAKGEVVELVENYQRNNLSIFSKYKHERVKWVKLNIYNRTPLYLRPIIYFFYRYVFCLGFLDGRAGFSFCFFQAFFYRMLIDQLFYEYQKQGIKK